MLRTITMHQRTGIIDEPSFFLTENEPLTLKFDGLSHRIGKYVVTIIHGKNKKTIYLPLSFVVDISAEFLKKGGNAPIEIYLELRNNAGTHKLIRSAIDENDKEGFFIEPLVVEKAETGLNVSGLISVINKLADRLSIVENRLAEFDNNGVPLICE